MRRVLEISAVTILFLIFGNFVLNLFFADFTYRSSQSLLTNQEYSKSQEYSEKAISLNPNEPRYFYGKAKVLLVQLPLSSKQEILDLLISAGELNPDNLVTLRNIVPYYYFLAVEDLQEPERQDNIDTEFLPTTIEYLEYLSNRYSWDLGVQVLVAKYQKKLGLTELYENKIEKIRQLRPDLLEWEPNL